MRYSCCGKCGTDLSFGNIKKLEDLDFAKLGWYCKVCHNELEMNLKETRFVEEYKGNKIYCKDGKYSPYWHSYYHFLSLEDTKKRIDNKNVAVVDLGAMAKMNSLLQ